VEFFRAGLVYRERLFCAANKIGKTARGWGRMCVSRHGPLSALGGRQVFTEPIPAGSPTSLQGLRDINEKSLLGRLAMTMPAARHSFHRTLSSRQLLNLDPERLRIHLRKARVGRHLYDSEQILRRWPDGLSGSLGSSRDLADEECPKGYRGRGGNAYHDLRRCPPFHLHAIMGLTELTVDLLDRAGV